MRNIVILFFTLSVLISCGGGSSSDVKAKPVDEIKIGDDVNPEDEVNPEDDISPEDDVKTEDEDVTAPIILNANAGDDQWVFEKDEVKLNAQYTMNIDSEEERNITYRWQQISGIPVILSGDNVVNPQFNLPYIAVDEVLDFELSITSGELESKDVVRIFVDAIESDLAGEPSINLFPCNKSGFTDELVSLHRGNKVEQCLTNNTSEDLRIPWIDYNGVHRLQDVLAIGQTRCNTVESSHLYKITSSMFQCRLYFLPSTDQPNVSITDELIDNLPYQRSAAQGEVTGLEGSVTLKVNRHEVTITKNGAIDLGEVASLNIVSQPDNQTCVLETHQGKNPHFIAKKNQVFIDDFTLTCSDACPSRVLNSGAVALRECGPGNNRVNLSFIGDGFTNDELTSIWKPHVDSVSTRMIHEEEPYARYHKFINVYRIDIASNESGADDIKAGTYVDTALGGHDTESNLCWLDWDAAVHEISTALGDIPSNWNIMALNYQPCTGTARKAYGGIYPMLSPINYEIMLHEAGHAFFDLADEYFTEGTTYSGGGNTKLNITSTPLTPSWAHWLGYAQPHLSGPIGTYEGGGYKEFGLWRPSPDSMMKGGYHPFDAVATEIAILEIYQHVNPIDVYTDNKLALNNRDIINIDVVDSNVIKLKWFLNDVLIKGMDSTNHDTYTLELSALNLSSGTYTLRALAYDNILDYNFSDNNDPHPLDLVRTNLDSLEQSVTWQILIP